MQVLHYRLTALFSDKSKSNQEQYNKTIRFSKLPLSHDLLPGLYVWLLSNYFFFSTGNHSHFGAVDLSAGFAFQSDFDLQMKPFLSAAGAFAAAMCVFGSYLICIPFLIIVARISTIADYNIFEETSEKDETGEEQENDGKRAKNYLSQQRVHEFVLLYTHTHHERTSATHIAKR
ncbi:MAG: hypothetical protein EZS28_040409 [Streblomastix strix]|uniref:Uncharacterized protein n=1 Tax=Streblomastix strix TaxID=222440 RepID=A0A5J4U0V3_9EUKA|nr:MAG: hypothetical protein EZS28_040409 [Streblomastix strix]